MRISDGKSRIGVLYVKDGELTVGNALLAQAALMAIDDINADGGVLGRPLTFALVEGPPDASACGGLAERLIEENGISALFGAGGRSKARRAIRRVVESRNALFWYPMSHEGLEQSPHIFYTGCTLNQQVIPAIRWCIDQGARRFYLVGSDHLYPITTHKLIRAILGDLGGTVVAEQLLPERHGDFYDVLRDIRRNSPDIVLNTLTGVSNYHFFRQFADVGYTASTMPILSTAIAEPEFQRIGADGEGHYACWTYFQSIDSPTNRRFVARFKERFSEGCVISDPVATAYSQIFMWRQIVEHVGRFDVDAVREGAAGQVLDTPAGLTEMRENQHLTKHAYIGKAVGDGSFDIVWRTESPEEPLPWLGVEFLDSRSIHLVRDILSLIPDTIDFNIELCGQMRAQGEELKETQLHYTAFINSSSDAISYWKTPDGLSTDLSVEAQVAMLYDAVCIDANRTCWEGFGVTEKALLVGRRYRDLMANRQNDALFEKFIRHAYHLSNEPITEHFVGGGEYFGLSNWHGAIRGGKLTHVWVSAKNVTQLKRAEETLKDSEARYRLLSNLSREGIAIHRDGVILDVNKAFCDIFKVEPDTVVGTDPFDALFDPRSAAIVRKHLASGYTGEYPATGLNRHGDEVLLEMEGRLIKYCGGDASVVILRDVTRRIRAETERERLQGQLLHAQKMASVGCLAGGIAHDFNNLLTVINGYAQLAAETARLGLPTGGEIQLIFEAGERAARLTRQLLAFSRKQVMTPMILDFGEIVTSLEKMLGRLIGEDVTLKVCLSEGLGLVSADPGQLEQVLLNLAVNARDAMPSGGDIFVETANVTLDKGLQNGRMKSAPGDYVMVSVRDTGVGMSRKVQQHIFDPFYTTKPKGVGTGLGLATVYGIVERSHGNIVVESEPGRGTTFKVFLPRVGDEKRELDGQRVLRELIGDETIFVVEDDSAVRELTQRILEGAGYRVIAAAGGRDALARCTKIGHHVSLAVVDVVMPGMSGKVVAECLKKRWSHLQVLYMSGYTDDIVFQHGVRGDDTPFLSKPFNTLSLLAKVRNMLDGVDASVCRTGAVT